MSASILHFPSRCTPSPLELARAEVRQRLRPVLSGFEISVAEAEAAQFISRGMLYRDAIERAVRNALKPRDPNPPLPPAA
jgi:hypothetical protein